MRNILLLTNKPLRIFIYIHTVHKYIYIIYTCFPAWAERESQDFIGKSMEIPVDFHSQVDVEKVQPGGAANILSQLWCSFGVFLGYTLQ